MKVTPEQLEKAVFAATGSAKKKPLRDTLEELCPGVSKRNWPAWAGPYKEANETRPFPEPKMTQDEDDEIGYANVKKAVQPVEGNVILCPNCGRSDGWHKAAGHPPPPVGDCRKICWLETPDGMAYWGVRAYSCDGEDTGWMSNGRLDTTDSVTYWMDGPHNPEYPMTAAYRVCMASRPDAAAISAQAFAEALHEVSKIIRAYAVEGGEPDRKEYPADTCEELLARIGKLTHKEPTLEERIEAILRSRFGRATVHEVQFTQALAEIAALMEAKK
jgi:hypothetical protein